MDAPDLLPEDCAFFITEAGISDSEEVTYNGPLEGETPAAENAASAEEPPKKGGRKKAQKKAPEPEVPEVGDEA